MSAKPKYCCETCLYYTNLKQNFTKHNESAKHKKKIQPNSDHAGTFHCELCKTYVKTKSGLWKHKKTCKAVAKQTVPSEQTAYRIDIHEIKQLLVKILESQNQPRNEVISTNNNNINIFLNEKCGNAVDIREFCKAMEVMEDHFKTVITDCP